MLLGPRSDETLTAFYNWCAAHGRKCIWITDEDIVKDLCIEDNLPSDAEPGLLWTLNGQQWRPDDFCGVLNRLTILSSEAFQAIQAEDRDYAYMEWAAYLLFALDQFSNTINAPDVSGLSGSTGALPQQWLLSKQLFPDIAVPQWFFGPQAKAPVSMRLNPHLIVPETPFDLTDWSPARDKKLAAFALRYKRPAGQPLTLVCIDQWCKAYGEEGVLTIPPSIRDHSLGLQSNLGLRAARFLYFVELDACTFAAATAGCEIEVVPDYLQDDVLRAYEKALFV